MLTEFKGVSQNEDIFRRLFFDNFFDLFVWYDKEGGKILGFELCYNKEKNEHSLIWKADTGYTHGEIETGENRPGKSKQSPVLVQDGIFDNKSLAGEFRKRSENLEKEIFDLVYWKIIGYGD